MSSSSEESDESEESAIDSESEEETPDARTRRKPFFWTQDNSYGYTTGRV